MLIDWFTVGAQALNFVVLVLLMKRFLYKPILAAIDKREQRIAGELADAAAKVSEAGRSREEFEQKNDALDQQRAELLRKASAAAELERKRLLEEAREAAEALLAQRTEALRSDARSLYQAIAQRTQKEVLAIARKALSSLAATELEARVIEVFVARLRALAGPARERLVHALGAAAEPALVRTAFELPATQQTMIQEALREGFAPKLELRFETAAALVSGIELTVSGEKVVWSISDYLESLEHGVEELLKPQATAAPAAVAAPAPVPTATAPVAEGP